MTGILLGVPAEVAVDLVSDRLDVLAGAVLLLGALGVLAFTAWCDGAR